MKLYQVVRVTRDAVYPEPVLHRKFEDAMSDARCCQSDVRSRNNWGVAEIDVEITPAEPYSEKERARLGLD